MVARKQPEQTQTRKCLEWKKDIELISKCIWDEKQQKVLGGIKEKHSTLRPYPMLTVIVTVQDQEEETVQSNKARISHMALWELQ